VAQNYRSGLPNVGSSTAHRILGRNLISVCWLCDTKYAASFVSALKFSFDIELLTVIVAGNQQLSWKTQIHNSFTTKFQQYFLQLTDTDVFFLPQQDSNESAITH
jgi:hypothetical protein